jgi:hypothetical protein
MPPHADPVSSHQGDSVENPELANAAWWYWLWELVGTIAFLGVIVTLAIEFGAARLAAPYRKIIDDAKDLKIAELNNETARLRKQVGPRSVNGEAFKKSLEGKPKAPVEIMFPREDIEAFHLALQLRDVLKISGWQAAEPVPVPPGDVPRLINQPSIASVGAYGAGVTVVIHENSQALLGRIGDVNADSPLNALLLAITQALGGAGAASAGPEVFHVPPLGVLRIVVGPKP